MQKTEQKSEQSQCESESIPQPEKMDCQYWFGYLSQKAHGEPVPESCVECEKVLECMLERYYSSEDAVAEIKKWF